ncbi:MBL fold metallo-hydrolase [Sphaerisporangium sp. TRM90804]|uniref:MBL fold metallo-hydrolase n=1 Tax=Sphaerisporangium sp. TRM90804 TaxID=3031113 RepID=UPI00244BEF7D|nr:MBL fold metallo-hydrolase [Sphaerisporangium sp. TRM90804]MDH2429667.1 MBL fold metallo-hydrolase [Sphaerisporangium sp. TRM90804]
MRLTVFGGWGAWPGAGQACGGYLLEHDGFRLLIDPGYAVVPRLLRDMDARDVDAVLVSHGHPDHCADLSPLLRARAFVDDPAPPLPVHTLPGAVDPVIALDRATALQDAHRVRDFTAGSRFEIGPFLVDSWPLPHSVPSAGLRLEAGGRVLAYTGDTGPSPDLVTLARDADVFLAEASYAEHVPAGMASHLSSARQAGRYADEAGVRRLVLTHLIPGTGPEAAEDAARRSYDGEIAVARPGLAVDLG